MAYFRSATLILLFGFLLLPRSAFTQSVMADHYVRQFQEAEMVLKSGDVGRGIDIIGNIQQEALVAGDTHVVLRTHIAFLNIYLQEETKADSILNLMWPLMKGRADVYDRVEYHVGRGQVARLRGFYSEQIEQLDSALLYALREDDPQLRGVTYFELAEAYRKVENFTASLEMSRRATQNFIAIGDQFYEAYGWGLLASNFADLQRYDSARIAVEKSNALFLATGNAITPAYNNAILGNMYLQKGDLILAATYLEPAFVELFGTQADPYNQVMYNQAFIWMSNLQRQQNQSALAAQTARRGLQLMDSLGQEDGRVEILEALIKAQVAGNAELAQNLEQFVEVQQKQFNRENIDGIRKYERKYRAEEALRKVSILNQKNEIAELRAERNRIWIIAILALVTVLGLLTTLFVVRDRQRSRRQIDALKQKALQLQINPHFFFNVLNSINDFVMHNDQRSAHFYLARFAKLMRFSLEFSRVDLVPIGKELELLESYLTLEQMRRDQFDFEIDCSGELRGILLPPLLIQPFVENAVVHAFARPTPHRGKIIVRIERAQGDILVSIIDNGIGLKNEALVPVPEEEEKTSLAIRILKERLTAFSRRKGEIIFSPAFPQHKMFPGTKVSVRIPV